MFNICYKPHKYYLFSTGTTMKPRTFDTRLEAVNAMYDYCSKHNVGRLELTEDDKHEKKFSNHKGVRFYINRI